MHLASASRFPTAVVAAACLVGLLGAGGCKKSAAKKEDPAFAAAWQQATAGSEPLVVGDTPAGEGLLDSVRRGTRRSARPAAPVAPAPGPLAAPDDDPKAAPAPSAPPTTTAPPAPTPTSPEAAAPQPDLNRLVHSSLGTLKNCYRFAEASLSDGGGKAIVRFKVMPSGAVDEVSVTAPEFETSGLPGCVTNQVRSWRFPSFAGSPMQVSYPIVFVGG